MTKNQRIKCNVASCKYNNESAEFCELEEILEIFSLLELTSLQSSLSSSHWRGSCETEEEDSSPHAASRARRMDRANNMRSECRGRLLAD